MQALERLVRSNLFEMTIITLIVINAIGLGLETTDMADGRLGAFLYAMDRIFLMIFTAELIARAIVFRWRFFHDPWRIFDLIVVSIAWIPATGGLSILRALRILRVLRLVSVVPSLRRVVGGLVAALPGMASILALLSLIFYVFSVMATRLFGSSFPEWFGSIGASAYSLFQIMTLESWSMGIVRPVMEVYPQAWLFFIPFIVCTTFTVLNLFIGIIVSAMQAEHEETAARDREELHNDQNAIISELKALRAEIAALRDQRPSS
ncbi:voltage-gated sodium channel [Zhengella mangrovi]|uniref:Voltage-gated sodium channel n=1 Tax=Zhengella mangrovi TaxID=1982044 RepID=A0A2G1QGZ3_9HYPH|nr:ion transporter [Zhengella mangrovi]PHP64729.1 voltage-gated sodium channel [Zhengella mangrovi]